jgi:hypothetical protein
MTIKWPDEVDEILAGDHVVALAYVTPASGVVLLPVTNFGVCDREAGTVTVNTSVAAWRKLDRIRSNPHVALAFHTREHALSPDRPEYVLVQGKASLSEPIADYPSTVEQWQRMEPWDETNRLWKWWLRYYALRVSIEVVAERIVVWPDLRCEGSPQVLGAALPSEQPRSQKPPARGTEPRINHTRAAKQASKLPHRLLGWVGVDSFPVAIPIEVGGTEERGILLETPEGLLPPGSRRAGLTAHWFSRGVVGQNQRKHTGWLEVESSGANGVYAPHTQSNYRLPGSRFVYRLAAGAGTRWWIRGAKRAGLVPD